MRLRISITSEIIVDAEVNKIIAEALNGSFCLLPRHIDFVAGLVPGILSYEDEDGLERFVGLDESVLVKRGSEVFVVSRNAVLGPDLADLKRRIEDNFENLDEREKKARTAISRLERSVIRRLMELGD